MALKAVNVTDVPNLDQVPENNASLSLYSSLFSSEGLELNSEATFKVPKFLVIGHRGHGMNILQSTDSRMKAIKENTILSFNSAAKFPIDFIEFDVQKVDPSLGFNIELKFDDHIVYQQDHLIHVLQVILQVVSEYAKDRPIIFSSFHPDAAQLVRKLQNTYPVFFLTNGGTQVYYDVRRNSLEEAIKVCMEGGLQGIVSEVKGVFGNPGAVPRIKESKLSLLTYGKLNNVPEAVCMQHLMGIDGVIVDFVQEISHAVDDMIVKPLNEGLREGDEETETKSKLQFSQQELSFLLKLIPELIHH
ncbi:hypothetical protein GOBAR_AA39974 [Gossypium barbadense]|uniref:glycerophosphodiester phosphodiesterase n=1 Tax=Gossypium barbadense TaxID=3634 RepID=A0A2P5VPG6_GOSBA|nr:hypothetical protein GOBAR_AA39974 [Gossypium barbadense]